MASAEFAIIELLRERCPAAGSDVVLGIGDDAAVTAVPAGMELVTATDALIEGTHFLPDAAGDSVGHRALAVNLSDLAAMGAEPRWASIALALPDVATGWVTSFADGFARLAAEHGVVLIGGDTVRGPRSVTVTLQGLVPAGQAVRRDGARPGDIVFVSGNPGHAGAGCGARLGTLQLPPGGDAYLRAFEYPQPRVALGRALRGLASAMIDISDGVHTDLQRLLQSSGCGAQLELPDIARLEADFGAEAGASLFLHGGEDYELCFTVPADRVSELDAVAAGVPLVELGEVSARPGLRWARSGLPLQPGHGFEHFGGAR